MENSQIPTLPLEVWLIIFDKMDPETFLTAKLVCKSWFEILGLEQRYAKRRTLNLRGKYIHDKSEHVNVLVNSFTEFDKIIFEDFTKFQNKCEIDLKSDLNSFWIKLSRTVSEVSFKLNRSEKLTFLLLHEILPRFQRLETLEIRYIDSWMDAIDKCKECNHKLSKIKILKFSLDGQITTEKVKTLLSMMPNLKDIHLIDVDYFAQNQLPRMLNLQSILNKLKTFSIYHHDGYGIYNLIPFPHFYKSTIELLKDNKVMHLNAVLYAKQTTLQDVYDFMDNFKHLETCELYYSVPALPTLKAKFITSLNISTSDLDLSLLDRFSKLKTFCIWEPLKAGCFFKHDECELNIETLELPECTNTCSKCYETFLNSCKHLKSIEISTSSGMELKYLKNMKTLQRLSIRFYDLNEQSIKKLEDLGSCTTLTDLDMQVIHPLEFYSFMLALPNLKSLRIVKLHMTDSITANYIFKEICKHLSNLSALKIDKRVTSKSLEVARKECDFMFDINCFFILPETIQSLEVPKIVKIPKTDFLSKLSELFEKYRKLEKIGCDDGVEFRRFAYEKSLPGHYDITNDNFFFENEYDIFL